jgi:hypothetical protein
MSHSDITNRIDKRFFATHRLMSTNKPREVCRDCGEALLHCLYGETRLFEVPDVLFKNTRIN